MNHAVSNASAKDGVASLPVFKGPFPETVNMRFLSQVDPEDLGALEVPGVWAKGMMNDIGGWTSQGGEEYALATNSGGIAIVRVTDPENPEYLGRVESQNPLDFRNIWGDPATFGNYAYFTTEIDGSGIVIIDMSGADALTATVDPFADLPLPSVTVAPGGYDGSHNIVINETTGYAYVAGAHLEAGAVNNACGAEEPARFNTLILDLNANPMDPTVAACISNAGEHDFHVVNYNGPDIEHAGKEILFVFDGRDREGQANGNPIGGKTLIWDVSDKNNIVELASFRIPGNVFSHNGATTVEQDFLFVGDEIEELVIANWAFSGFFTQPLDETTKKARISVSRTRPSVSTIISRSSTTSCTSPRIPRAPGSCISAATATAMSCSRKSAPWTPNPACREISSTSIRKKDSAAPFSVSGAFSCSTAARSSLPISTTA
jgi:choice-of-anchor B domain-containing protein